MKDDDPDPDAFAEGLSAFLRGLGVLKTSVIRVMGKGGLPVLLWLCRHGYEQAGYARPGPTASEEADLLLVPQSCEPQALETMLEHGPHLRAGGLLIVQTAGLQDWRAGREPIQSLLGRHGFRIEQRVNGRHRALHVARRQAFRTKTAA